MEQEIEKALKGIENAAKAAVKVLAKFAGNDLAHTGLVAEPLARVGAIVQSLQQAKIEVAELAKYEGLSEDDIATKKAAERADELDLLQQAAQAKLADYHEASKVIPEAEPTDEPTDDPATGGEGDPTE